ncbi:MAG TPA: ligase-associated DNA damage response endonuclease PdeM [Parasegetibacter sp.]
MKLPLSYKLKGQQLWLSPHRSIFWEDQKALILSDLHLGKTGHFRKSGIAVPQAVYKEDLQRLLDDIQYFQPDKMIVVGDMFHSVANKEHDLFLKWRMDLKSPEIFLIKGNHDILHPVWYKHAGIQLCDPVVLEPPFLFCHEAPEICTDAEGHFVFSGHLHPGISIKLGSKQKLRFPCFYFTRNYAILPAYGRFTGLASVKPEDGDEVFAIVNDEVLQMDSTLLKA